MTRGKFSLGQVVATPRALAVLTADELADVIGRHWHGDWGVADVEDREANDAALRYGNRVLSAYLCGPERDTRVWVITEADRSSTTILLPEEY